MLKKIENLFFKKGSSNSPSDRELFAGAMFMADKIVKNDPDDLKFLLNVFGKKIQSQYLGNFFCHAGIEDYFNDSTRDLKRLSPETLFIDPQDGDFNITQREWFYDEIRSKGITKDRSITVDLSKDVVLPWPWKANRILDCLKCIGEGKVAGSWQYDDTNHRLNYWEEIGILFVYGGNHSIATGVLRGEGILPNCQKTSMKHIYDQIWTDGDYYYRKRGNENIKVVPVRCLDFAILFEMGRKNTMNWFKK